MQRAGNRRASAKTQAAKVNAEGGADGYGIRASGGLTPIQLVPSMSSAAARGMHSVGEIYVDSYSNVYVCVAAGQDSAAVFRKIAGTINNSSTTTYTAGALHLLTIPDRLVETRGTPSNRGGVVGPLSPGQDYIFPIAGVPGRDGSVIPANATTVVGSLVIITPTSNGFAKLAPNNPAINLATQGSSTVNFNGGFNTATSFNSGLFNGQVKFRLFLPPGKNAHLVIDIVGFYI